MPLELNFLFGFGILIVMKEDKSNTIFRYIRSSFRGISIKGSYIVLLLFFAFNQDGTPSWAKKIIIGSIAYFLNPFDSIPDLTPFLGMTDDLGVLSFGLVTIACYINEEVRTKATHKLSQLMNNRVDESILTEVNSWL